MGHVFWVCRVASPAPIFLQKACRDYVAEDPVREVILRVLPRRRGPGLGCLEGGKGVNGGIQGRDVGSYTSRSDVTGEQSAMAMDVIDGP